MYKISIISYLTFYLIIKEIVVGTSKITFLITVMDKINVNPIHHSSTFIKNNLKKNINIYNKLHAFKTNTTTPFYVSLLFFFFNISSVSIYLDVILFFIYC